MTTDIGVQRSTLGEVQEKDSGRMLAPHSADSPNQFDITKYATIVGQHWRLVVGMVVLAVIMAAIASMILGRTLPRYQSTVTILLTGPRYKIAFDPKFANVDSATLPPGARTEEYRTIALSPEIQFATIQALSGQLSPQDVDEVTINVTVRGQLITIMATSENPE